MAHNDEAASSQKLLTAELLDVGRKQSEKLIKAQTELFGEFQQSNQHWMERIQSEAQQASKLVSDITASRSIPDAVTKCQQWGSQRFERMVQDGTHLLEDAQKFMQAAVRMLSNRTPGSNSNISTHD